MNKASKIIILLLIFILLAVLGVGGYVFIKYKDESDKKIGELENKIVNINEKDNSSQGKSNGLGSENKMFNENNNSNQEKTNETNTGTNVKNENQNKSDRKEIDVHREGSDGDMVDMKLYKSTLGYEMYYYDKYFEKISNNNYSDSFYNEDAIASIAVTKVQMSLESKKASTPNCESTKINGHDALYINEGETEEGYSEATYYVDSNNGYIFEISIGIKNDSEYIEGIGVIMNAMVKTFKITTDRN